MHICCGTCDFILLECVNDDRRQHRNQLGDIADQLTAAQCCALENTEHKLIDQGVSTAQLDSLLLDHARYKAEMNLTDLTYAEVPVPAGASVCDGWGRNDRGDWSRGLIWRSFKGGRDVSVDIDGCQVLDGSFTRRISLRGLGDDGGNLTSAQARELAAMLIEAAGEIDKPVVPQHR